MVKGQHERSSLTQNSEARDLSIGGCHLKGLQLLPETQRMTVRAEVTQTR